MKQTMTAYKPPMPMGQVLYLADYQQAAGEKRRAITWERTEGIPNWLETVSNWVEVLATGAMTALSVYWMWYCMVCV